MLTTSRQHAWRAELRRALWSWRSALLAAASALYLSSEFFDLRLVFSYTPGAQGALAFTLNNDLPGMPLALAAGVFAAFGLVEDYSYGRRPYAHVRAGTSRRYLLARVLAPAIALATAVLVGCTCAMGFAFLLLPPGPTALKPGFGQPWPLLDAGPLIADLALTGLVVLHTAALTVLASVIARSGRQLATLLLPPAFLVITGVLARGPLEVLGPGGRVSADTPGELVANLTYWAVLGGLALAASLVLARRPTPGRPDA
ncbi:MAG: hypothetical protein ACT4RN_08825 [Pseudonocardia sp.]